MGLYAWRRPAWFSISPVDHTWVTDFDLRYPLQLGDQSAVDAAGNNYWYCKGGFYTDGVPPSPVIDNANPSHGAACLVDPNNTEASGTIRYGIDGVCHQIANQVLYPSTKKLVKEKVRGYALSRYIYGEYGLRQEMWNRNLMNCGLSGMTRAQLTSQNTFMLQRARYLFGVVSTLPEELDNSLTVLRGNISEIGLAARGAQETPTGRGRALNQRINAFLLEANSMLTSYGHQDSYIRLFAVEPGVEINLIDPEAFRFL